MGNITVRRAAFDDYDVIGQLLGDILRQHQSGRPDLFESQADVAGKYSPSEFKEFLADEDIAIFAACEDQEVVGYLISKIIDTQHNPVLKKIKRLYIDDLCVDKDHRHTGAGRLLMEAAEEFARETGCYNITLNVWEFNENAKAFYEHLGYGTQRREMEKILG